MAEGKNARADLPLETGAAAAYDLDEQTGYLLGRASTVAYRNLSRRISDLGITPPQHSVIMKLYAQGQVSQNRLGRLVGMEPATIHGIVKRLAARGLLVLEQAADDKRRLLAALTDRGRVVADELALRSQESTAATVAPLTKAEVTALNALLKKITAGASADA
jgi:DNA-binding MarR family transcriptional regulator